MRSLGHAIRGSNTPPHAQLFEWPNELFTVVLFDARYNNEVPYVEGTRTAAAATVVIEDDGDAGTVGFEPAQYTREEGDGVPLVWQELHLSRVGRAVPSGNITVIYSTFNGTALAGEDFLLVHEGRVEMDSGVNETTIRVGILDDLEFEYPGADAASNRASEP